MNCTLILGVVECWSMAIQAACLRCQQKGLVMKDWFLVDLIPFLMSLAISYKNSRVVVLYCRTFVCLDMGTCRVSLYEDPISL